MRGTICLFWGLFSFLFSLSYGCFTFVFSFSSIGGLAGIATHRIHTVTLITKHGNTNSKTTMENKIKDECEFLYKRIQESKDRLKEIRDKCPHDKKSYSFL